MADTKIKSRWKGFWILFAVIALIYGMIGGYLVYQFSGYLRKMDDKNTARENARPELAVETYIAGLSGEHIAELLESLYAQTDGVLQSREDFRALVSRELSGGIGYKAVFTSAGKRTYALYLETAEADGRHRQIGEITIEPKGESRYGYAPWVVTQERFDMSYLLTPSQEFTVPHNYSVWVGGKVLDQAYVAQEGMDYPALAPVKGVTPVLNLPTLTTYRVGPLLGNVSVEIRDPAGNPVTIPENGDWDAYLPLCPEAEAKPLQDMVTEYMGHYVIFGSSKGNRDNNYKTVLSYIVRGGDLEQRLSNMRGGVQWTDDYPDQLVSLAFNRILALEDGRYICDITYVVNVVGSNDSSLETTHCQIVLLIVDGEPKVESMVNYLPK